MINVIVVIVEYEKKRGNKMENLKLNAVKGRLETIDYFLSSMNIENVVEFTKPIDKYIPSKAVHKVLVCNDNMLNLKIHPKSLTIGIYGHPQWQTYGNSYNIGVLSLSRIDEIFIIGEQCYFDEIKQYCKNNKEEIELSNISIPIIFVQHENNREGKKRTLELFESLNRFI